MPIPFSCAGCGAKSSAPERKAGIVFACHKCGEPVTVPVLAAEVVELEAEDFIDDSDETYRLASRDLELVNNPRFAPFRSPAS